MTREQKLALIVGFSLILLVGVLISDHLSGARKASIAKVEPEKQPPITQPLPAPMGVAERRAEPPITIANNPQPALQQPQAPAAPERQVAERQNPEPVHQAPVNEPTTIAATNPARGSMPAEERTLADEVRRLGGDLVRGPDGVGVITLPPPSNSGRQVAGTPEKTAPAGRGFETSPIPTRVGPIETLRTHAVANGENLYQIAARYYGNGNLWRDLAKFNAMEKSGTIRVGMKLKIPSKETLTGVTSPTKPGTIIDPLKKPAVREAVSPVSPPKPAPMKATKPGRIELASYTVRKGDTLGQISFHTLGTSKRWQEIVDLNNLDDEDNIPVGTVLKIPGKRS